MARDLNKKHEELLQELNVIDDKLAYAGYIKELITAARDAVEYPDAKVYCKIHLYVERDDHSAMGAKEQLDSVMGADNPEDMMKMLSNLSEGKSDTQEEKSDPIVHDIKLECLENRDFLAIMDLIINKLKSKLK